MTLAGAALLAAVVYVPGMRSAPEPVPAAPATRQGGAPVWGYEIVQEYPHDRDAFTQGLLYRDGHLYESTGQYGRSSLRKVELDTGRVLQRRAIDAMYFAEGLAAVGSRLLQLTWKENVAFVYDLASFEPLRTFRYPGEGWGLTYDGRRLIMSDGTAQLRFLDAESFEEQGRVTVRDGRMMVQDLNELEYVAGQVYANVWGSDRIAVIDPDSGRVTAWVDLAGILRPALRRGTEDVLNGIAHVPDSDRLFVTGKYWPALFEIRVRPDAHR